MSNGMAQEFGKAARSRTLLLAFSIKVFGEHYPRSAVGHEEGSGFFLSNHNFMRGRSFWVWSWTPVGYEGLLLLFLGIGFVSDKELEL